RGDERGYFAAAQARHDGDNRGDRVERGRDLALDTRAISDHWPPIRRRALASGERWAVLPHAYAFVDPLFSTGIAWGLRGVERIASAFEQATRGTGIPDQATLTRYDALLAAEADQIDCLVAGAYQAMAHFDLFAAHAMIYFALVSYSEVQQRFDPDEDWAWNGF